MLKRIKEIFINQCNIYKAIILQESKMFNGFYVLLFKQINTGQKWTKEEIKEIKRCLLRISYYVPVLIIFLLPGGGMLLPLLANFLDRRKDKRLVEVKVEAN